MRLTKSFFMNIPRTGSVWVQEALRGACTVEKEFKGHIAFSVFDHEMKGRRPFTFIRHPLAWYASYWAKMDSEGWERGWEIKKDDRDGINIYQDLDFNEFMKKVLAHKPKFYSEMVGQRLFHKPLVGRTEYLMEDLISILEICEEPFSEEAIRATPRLNVSLHKPSYQPEIKALLLEAESEFINRWNLKEVL